jgi:hypothetical protein
VIRSSPNFYRNRRWASTLLIAWALLASGCRGPSSNLLVVPMKIGSQQFNLEVAADQATQELGLMRRDSMPADHGMIFIFNHEEVLNFWMKDTRFPLDIIFMDRDGKIVSIHQMEAYDLNTTSSDAAAQYAIELNKNTVAPTGVHVGDQLQIPASALKH